LKNRQYILGLVLCLGLCACTEESGSWQEPKDLLRLTSYARPFEEGGAGQTRAVGSMPSGYEQFETVYPTVGSSPLSFGLFLIPQATNVPSDKQLISYQGAGQWQSYVEVKQIPYYLYGFYPDEAVGNASISMLEGAADYSEGAQLTLSGLPSVSSEDLCVVVGVQNASSDESPWNLHLGRFSYEGKPVGQNYVGLLLAHLYAGVEFQLKVDETYHALRHIRLKKMVMETDLSSMSMAGVSVEVHSNDLDQDPIVDDLAWSVQAGGNEAVLYDDATGMDLSPTPSSISGFMAPPVNSSLSMKCWFDVYDTSGHLVREGAYAENHLGTKVSASLKPGQKSVVNITIVPTYVYQLSEHDLDGKFELKMGD
jgi:hypothetical protein